MRTEVEGKIQRDLLNLWWPCGATRKRYRKFADLFRYVCISQRVYRVFR